MNEPNQAWVSIHLQSSDVSIFVNDGFQKSLTIFARKRGIALQLISPDAISSGGKAVTLEYHTTLKETEAKKFLSDGESLRGERS